MDKDRFDTFAIARDLVISHNEKVLALLDEIDLLKGQISTVQTMCREARFFPMRGEDFSLVLCISAVLNELKRLQEKEAKMNNKEYALIVQGREMKGDSGHIMTRNNEWFLVLDEPEGWVPATSIHYSEGNSIRKDAKLFKTPEEAEAFAKTWKGHPWWCSPNGKFRVVEVEPVYGKPSIDYYKEIGEWGFK